MQLKSSIWGMSRSCLVRINVIRKGVSEKAVASIWVVVYMAVALASIMSFCVRKHYTCIFMHTHCLVL